MWERARSSSNRGSPRSRPRGTLFPSSSRLWAPAGNLTAAAVQSAPRVPTRPTRGAAHALGGRWPWGPTLTRGDRMVPGWLVLGRGEPSVCPSVRPWHGAASPHSGRAGQREKPQHHTWLWENTFAETVSRGWGPGSVALGPCPPGCQEARGVGGGAGGEGSVLQLLGEGLTPLCSEGWAPGAMQPREGVGQLVASAGRVDQALELPLLKARCPPGPVTAPLSRPRSRSVQRLLCAQHRPPGGVR